MRLIADLHIHSRYSRACSANLTLPNLDYWAKIKGIDILGTGDFTHPVWFKHLQENLVEAAVGFYLLPSEKLLPESTKWSKSTTFFVLSSEISCIYSRGGKVRRVHLLVLAPSLKTAGQINIALEKIGNLSADGRPILGIDAQKLAELILKIDPACLVIPAHVWTPWFAVFGSKSGFDSLEECFGDLTSKIYAIETGLSSDPPMNWRVKALDSVTLVSNSDAHSLANLGREANVFDLPVADYFNLAEAIKSRKNFLETLEFFPEEGKYHLDGHASCGIRMEPKETVKLKNLCPSCQKPLTIGVLNRVEVLANRPMGDKPSQARPFRSIVPLIEIIAEAFGKSKTSRAVADEYQKFVREQISEFSALLDLNDAELLRVTVPRVTEGIIKVRQGKVIAEGGYDGVYGRIRIFNEAPGVVAKQSQLFK